jgi:hypothetical protein
LNRVTLAPVQDLLSWPVFLPSVIALITLGFGVLTLPKRPEYTVAKGSFCVAAGYACINLFVWGITTPSNTLIRMAICFALFGCIGLLTVEGIRLVDRRKQEAVQEQETKKDQQNNNVSPAPIPPAPESTAVIPETPSQAAPTPERQTTSRQGSRRNVSRRNDTEDILLGRKKGPKVE